MSLSVERQRLSEVAALCLEAGRLMLSSGAETSRVEETVRRLGAAAAVPVETVVTPTGLTLVAGDDHTVTRVARIRHRRIDLWKVASVNEVSRDLENGRISTTSALRNLRRLAAQPARYPLRWGYLAQGLATGGFSLVLGGGFLEFVPAVLAGLLVRALDEHLHRADALPTFATVFVSSLALTLWAAAVHLLVPALSVDRLALAGILPLMPGLALTNAVRDLMAGDLLSGVARGAEALLQAAAISAGVLVALAAGRGWLV